MKTTTTTINNKTITIGYEQYNGQVRVTLTDENHDLITCGGYFTSNKATDARAIDYAYHLIDRKGVEI